MATVGEWLKELADNGMSTESDSAKMQNLLHTIGFSAARVVLGIVYLDGKGTLEAPPISIHAIAKQLLQAQQN